MPAMKYLKKIITCVLTITLIIICGCQDNNTPSNPSKATTDAEYESAMHIAETTPLGRYPEQLTYTLGKLSGANNSNLPQGETYENNAYTQILNEILNVQNQDIFEAADNQYDDNVSMVIAQKDLPDVMIVQDMDELQYLVENDMIEDLTDSYNNCMSETIKNIYKSYGSSIMDVVTFDDRIMAIPETNISDGPNLIWLRKDWMDKLGLEEPQTLEEAFDVIEAFRKNRMGAAPGEDSIGLVCDTSLVGTTSSSYSVDPVFQKFGANPQRWQKGENGEVVYGSLTEETKNALEYLNQLYERGILDENFALRAQNNLRDLVVSGKCGAFFGLWWTPNNPLMDEYEEDPDSDWEPYYFPAEIQKTAETYSTFRDNKYVVVRKGYEHPEIVMKILSVLFDYTRYEAKDADEMNSYFALNVDPTARPLVINVDYNEATYRVTEHIQKVIAGDMEEEKLSAIEKSYYQACRNYMEGQNVTVEDWAAYKSRISAVGLLVKSDYRTPEKIYLQTSNLEIPQTLGTLEKNTFIQIIMGKRPISYFDEFVSKWYEQGGNQLVKAIREDSR